MFDRVIVAVDGLETDRPLVDAALSLSLHGALRLLTRRELEAREPGVPLAKALVRVAARWNADLLALSATAHRAFAGVLPGDVARMVAHRSPVPVLLAGDRDVAVQPPVSIAVPIERLETSFVALEAAADLAVRFDARLLVLADVDGGGKRPSQRLTQERLERLASSLPAAASARLEAHLLEATQALAARIDLLVCAAEPVRGPRAGSAGLMDRLVASGALPLLLVPPSWQPRASSGVRIHRRSLAVR